MPKSPSKDTTKTKTTPQKPPVKKVSIKEKEHETVSKIVSELVHDLEKNDSMSVTPDSTPTDTQEVEAIVANLAAKKSNENKESSGEIEKIPEEAAAEPEKAVNMEVEEAQKPHEEVTPEVVEERHSFFEGGETLSHRLPTVHHSNKKLFLVGFSVFCATVIITSLGYLAIMNVDKIIPKNDKKADITVKTPTPTITPEVFKRADWSLEILNGSGVAGVAKKTADTLEKSGYTIGTVGNSAKNITETQIFITDSKSTEDKAFFLADIKKLLGVDASISGTLSNSKSAARIIVGSN